MSLWLFFVSATAVASRDLEEFYGSHFLNLRIGFDGEGQPVVQ